MYPHTRTVIAGSPLCQVLDLTVQRQEQRCGSAYDDDGRDRRRDARPGTLRGAVRLACPSTGTGRAAPMMLDDDAAVAVAVAVGLRSAIPSSRSSPQNYGRAARNSPDASSGGNSRGSAGGSSFHGQRNSVQVLVHYKCD